MLQPCTIQQAVWSDKTKAQNRENRKRYALRAWIGGLPPTVDLHWDQAPHLPCRPWYDRPHSMHCFSLTWTAAIALYGIFIYDFGDREHVFQPVRSLLCDTTPRGWYFLTASPMALETERVLFHANSRRREANQVGWKFTFRKAATIVMISLLRGKYISPWFPNQHASARSRSIVNTWSVQQRARHMNDSGYHGTSKVQTMKTG